MPKVSVIVPVYGVEAYIGRCARSLMEQTLEDIEYIFVDDCSPDRSMEILQSVINDYPLRKKQVRFERMDKNSGLPGVRKYGVAVASGDYIIHCDSDDWVDVDMYRQMYEKAVDEDLDVVICDYYLTDGVSHRYWGQHGSIDPLSAMLNNKLSASVCNKLVRGSIVRREDYVFPTENICEDFVHNVHYFIFGPKVGYVEKALYYYYRHSGNMTNVLDERRLINKTSQIVKNISLALSIIENNGFGDKYFNDIIHQKLFVKKNYLPIIGSHYSLWHDTFSEINGKVLSCPSISIKEKLLFVIAYLKLFPLYQSIKHD